MSKSTQIWVGQRGTKGSKPGIAVSPEKVSAPTSLVFLSGRIELPIQIFSAHVSLLDLQQNRGDVSLLFGYPGSTLGISQLAHTVGRDQHKIITPARGCGSQLAGDMLIHR